MGCGLVSEESAAAWEVAHAVRVGAAQLDDVGDFARHDSALPGWIGHAADAYRRRARDLVASTDAMSLLLREAGTALELYAGRVADPEADGEAAAAALVDALSRLLPSGWRSQLGREDPGDRAVASCPRGGSAAEIRQWWHRLSDVEREAVLVVSPGLIGRLDGLPATVRSQANLIALTRDVSAGHWRREQTALSPEQRRVLEHADETQDALDELEQRGLSSQLYLYDPDAFEGDGKVAIGVGDLDTADHLGILVPGFGNDASDLSALTERAGNLYEVADHASDDAVAVLGWLGYDTPDNVAPWGSDLDALEVVSADAADAGGLQLDALVDGFRAAEDTPHITAIGHSYGSVTLGQSAHDHRLAIDDLVVVGSPGLGPGVTGPEDLGLGREHVWVGVNSRDPVARLGDHGWLNPGAVGLGLGNDPAEDAFDAQRFRAESTTRAGDDNTQSAIEDHSKYFDHDTESLSNLGYVITGQPERVEHAGQVRDSWRNEPQDPEWERTPRERATH